MILIRRIIQSTVESLPELLHAVAASASIWGAGSLQVLELTPASPVSTCTQVTPFLETSSLTEPQGLLHRSPFNDTLTALTRILVFLV